MKKLIVRGAGESGVGTAVLASQKGYEVFVSDRGTIGTNYRKTLEDYNIEFEEEMHSEDRILKADLIMKSPGIPETVPLVKKVRKKKIPIVSEIEFAYPYCDGKIIGITGSNGKTTTTHLTYHIFKTAGYNVGMAGNVGISFAYMLATDPKDYYILEVSSFQLDDINQFKCDVSILLNIVPDHLDRYDYKMSAYVESKFRITNNQKGEDIFIYSEDDSEIQNYLSTNKSTIKSTMYPFSIKKKIERGAYIHQENLILNT